MRVIGFVLHALITALMIFAGSAKLFGKAPPEVIEAMAKFEAYLRDPFTFSSFSTYSGPRVGLRTRSRTRGSRAETVRGFKVFRGLTREHRPEEQLECIIGHARRG
jgi:hypothetical protein